MSLSRTVSEINCDLVENRKFFPPHVFNVPAEGVPLELGTDARSQKARMVGLPE